jgi:DNA-binding MarR family transcriptional regulator
VSEPSDPSPREELLQRIARMRTGPVDSGPLVWHDIAFLVHGMAFASRPLHHATDRVTERYKLGPRGTWVLNLVAIGLNHPHELAEMLQIGRSLVSAELARLTEAGLIVARQGRRDRRRSELALTAEGEKALEEVRGELARLVTDSLSHYTPEQLRLCGRILADMQSATAAR